MGYASYTMVAPKNKLLKAAQSGDMDAFASLFEELRPMVYAIAIRCVGEHDADDVVMESFLRAWKALPRFRAGASLKTWLYRIAHNCAVDVIRKRQRHPTESLSARDGAAAVTRDVQDDAQVAPDAQLLRSELAAGVNAALARLSESHRTVLQLRYSDGFSYREIAAATGVSIGTVMSRLFHGKRQLREVLRRECDDET